MTRLQRSGLRAVAIVWACPVAAHLPPMPDIPRVAPPALPADGHYKVVIPNRPDPVPVVLHVSPAGSDEGDGSAVSPFASLIRAQQAVRTLNPDHDVTLSLAAGFYLLEAPLRFTARDGGQNGYTVRWEGAPGMDTMLSGGTPVTGWGLVDSQRNIWSARVPASMDPRQLSVGGRLAQRASVEIPRSSVAFHRWGIEIKDPAWRFLANLPDQSRLEVEGISWFTHRHAMVDRIEGDRIVMQQPGWRNNLVGYDTVAKPVSAEVARMFLVNALAFLRDPGQWFIDPKAGRLYYKPLPNEDMNRIVVVVPRLERLVSIAGTYDDPLLRSRVPPPPFQPYELAASIRTGGLSQPAERRISHRRACRLPGRSHPRLQMGVLVVRADAQSLEPAAGSRTGCSRAARRLRRKSVFATGPDRAGHWQQPGCQR